MIILISVLAMICKTIIDFIGIKTAKEAGGQNINTYYLLQSMTILGWLLVLLLTGINKVQFDLRSILFGLLVGMMSFFGYHLFLQSLQGKSGSVNVTIYRLNFIVSSVLGVLLLNEKITLGKVLGITFCLTAIMLFINFKDLKPGKIDKYILFSILACLTMGTMNIFNKIALGSGVTSNSLLTFVYSVVVIAILISYKITRKSLKINKETAPKKLVILSVISGSLMLISLYLLYYALRIGDVSIVTPIVQSCFIFTSILCFIFFKEKLTGRKVLGILFAIACIVVIGL